MEPYTQTASMNPSQKDSFSQEAESTITGKNIKTMTNDSIPSPFQPNRHKKIRTTTKRINATEMNIEQMLKTASKAFIEAKKQNNEEPTTEILIAYLSGITTGLSASRDSDIQDNLDKIGTIIDEIIIEYDETDEIET